MNETIASCIPAITFGEASRHGRMEIVPLFCPSIRGTSYDTLGKTLDTNRVVITEIGETGSVTRLQLVNRSESPVLLLDGEEIAGAKQNRALNTTILVPGGASLAIPVSCTERGRWSSVTPVFYDSGEVLERRIRAKKMATVSRSIKEYDVRLSDHMEIWEGIDGLSARSGVHTPTAAMKAVYESRLERLKEYLAAFPCHPGQQGLFVSIDGRPVGMDLLSLPEAYASVHDKLVRSYALDLVVEERDREEPSAGAAPAADFLRRISRASSTGYPAIGLGTEFRLHGEDLVGSALVHDEKVIHMAFFTRKDDAESSIAGYRARKGYRRTKNHDDEV